MAAYIQTRVINLVLRRADNLPVSVNAPEYVAFLAGGGVPDVNLVDQAEDQRRLALIGDGRRAAMLSRIANATPAQIDTYLLNNVTNLAQARDVLGDILKLIALDLRQ